MTRIARTWHLIPLAVIVAAGVLHAQLSEQDVRSRLDLVYSGHADQVRAELPALLAKYPNDAGVRYIQAVLTTDGTAAVKRYEEIAEKYPQSAWADDALYKVYQYDFSNGLYKKADSVMAHLRSAYPRSIYAGAQGAETPQAQPKKEEPPVQKPKPAPGNPAKSSSVGAREQKDMKTPAAGIGGAYDVQAGVFSTESAARTEAGRMTALAGREARVKPRTNDRTVYLVVFEGFETAESAKRFSTELRTKHNIDSFVNPR